MKRKASSALLVAFFLAVLFCPHILWRAFPEQTDGENPEKRIMTERPVFSLAEIEAYPKAYEEYYNDHLPFRDHLIKLYNSLLYYGFHTSSHENVIAGKDGWLFYSSPTDGTTIECYTGNVLFTDEELERMVRNLTAAKDRLAEQDIEFVVFIAPNKERVYSEYMPDHYGEQAEDCMLNQALAHLRANTDIRIVYPYEELKAYKEAHPQQELYYKTDSHWNEIGGYIGARALLGELGIDVPPLEQYDITAIDDHIGDLAGMLNTVGMIEKDFYTQVSLKTDVSAEESAQELQQAPVKKILMRRDSFGDAMTPYLRHSIPDTVVTHYGQFQPEQIWAEKPDVFVIQIVERYVRWLRNEIF